MKTFHTLGRNIWQEETCRVTQSPGQLRHRQGQLVDTTSERGVVQAGSRGGKLGGTFSFSYLGNTTEYVISWHVLIPS